MLDYRSEQRFKFVETPYISDTLLILKDVSYQKEDHSTHTPPAHIYLIYQHGRLGAIGKVKFSLIDSVEDTLQGFAEYIIDESESKDCYVYHLCMLLKQVARTYSINKFYLSIPDYCAFTIEEKNKLNITNIQIDEKNYYSVPVEPID